MNKRQKELLFRFIGTLQFLALGHTVPVAFGIIGGCHGERIGWFVAVPSALLGALLYGCAVQFESYMERADTQR